MDKDAAAAAQLLKDLTGSYQELWPVILADEHTQTWLDDCTALVGEDNAQGAYEKLSSMVTGEVYGEDAVKAYANGGGAYFCGFTNDLVTLTGPILPLWFMKDAYIANLTARGKDAAYINTLFAPINSGSFAACVVLILVCAVLGGVFGQKMMKKHFEKAGIVA